MNFKRVLIDGDILTYRIGFTTEDVEEGIARWRLEELIERIMDQTGTKDSVIYLTSADRSNFRFELFPEYKANRKNKPKPKHYEFLRNTMEKEFMAQVISGEEADDALGIELTKSGEDAVVATIDKDLDMIPGWHYNFVKEVLYKISPLEGMRSFYYQCLVGDKSTDNIEGCPRIGPVKATRMLEGAECESEMFQTVLRQYLRAYGDEAPERLWLAGHLLWIRREPGQSWTLPNGEVASKSQLKRAFEQQV